MRIMRPGHRRWFEVLHRLEGPEGCDFRRVDPTPGNPSGITFNCGTGKDKSKATAILKEMGDIDIDASLRYFERHGGFCDCQVLFNVRYDIGRGAVYNPAKSK